MIKAIETVYKGYRFRSRLEARWAVFFEKLGWEWRYEHQGYEIGWGEDRIPWLPDFEITVPRFAGEPTRLYVEVKGDPDFFADGGWLDRLDFGGGPPGFSACADAFPPKQYQIVGKEAGMPIMLLGAIPAQQWGRLFVPVITHDSGIFANWTCVCSQSFIAERADLLFQSFVEKEQFECLSGGQGLKDFQPILIPTKLADAKVVAALDAARQARFEHGETP